MVVLVGALAARADLVGMRSMTAWARSSLVMLVSWGQCAGWSALLAADPSVPRAGIEPIALVRRVTDQERTGISSGDSHVRVAVRGRVTWVARAPLKDEFAVVQDDSAGIWINIRLSKQRGLWRSTGDWEEIQLGALVEVVGLRDANGFAPMILPETLRLAAPPDDIALPPAIAADGERLFSGADDSQRVVIDGVLQGVRDDVVRWILVVESQGRRFFATMLKGHLETDPLLLIDGVLSVTGVATARYTTRGQFVSPTIHVARPEDLRMVAAPRSAPFDAPAVPLERIARFDTDGPSGHRIRTTGTVTYSRPGRVFYLQTGAFGLRVETPAISPLALGDLVEVAGFVDRSRVAAGAAQAAVITEAIYRRVGTSALPAPITITPDDVVVRNREAQRDGLIAATGDYDGALIEFPARLLEMQRLFDDGVLMLACGRSTLAARIPGDEMPRLRHLQSGSELLVRGIVQCDLGPSVAEKPIWGLPTVERMELLLRSAGDIRLLRAPSRWTARRLGMLLGGVGIGLAGTLAWVWLLRRQVTATTHRLAAEMRSRRDAAVEYQATIGERNRLAANLHDTLLQTLGGVGYQLDACEAGGLLRPDGPRLHFDVARRMINHATGELQRSVWAMRSLPIPDHSLTESLRILATRLGEGHHAAITIETSAGVDGTGAVAAGQILLLVQEAITNALRHGRPRAIHVTVEERAEENTIHVTVADDGAGFTLGEQRGPESGHFGIHGMRERAERLGGSLRIESRPGAGTVVRAVITQREYDDELNPVEKP